MKGFIKTLRNDPFLLHEKIISGELPLAKSLPRMLECLRHVQPKTAKAFQCEVLETRTGWDITLDGKEEV